VSTINLIPDATTQNLPDGSSIDGQTTFTKTDGITGTAAAVTFAYDAQGKAVNTVTTFSEDWTGMIANDNRAVRAA